MVKKGMMGNILTMIIIRCLLDPTYVRRLLLEDERSKF